MKTSMKSLITTLLLALFTFGAIPASADDAAKAHGLVIRSLRTFEDFVSDPDMEWFRYELKYAIGEGWLDHRRLWRQRMHAGP